MSDRDRARAWKPDLLGQRAVVAPTLDESLDEQADLAWEAYVKALAVAELRKPHRFATLPWYVRAAVWVWTRAYRRAPR